MTLIVVEIPDEWRAEACKKLLPSRSEAKLPALETSSVLFVAYNSVVSITIFIFDVLETLVHSY